MFTLKNAKRVVIAVMGGTLLLIGAALMVLPGPGIPVVLAGLAVLAIEFAWARRWLKKVREWMEAAKNKIKGKNSSPKVPSPTDPQTAGKPRKPTY